MSKFHYDIKPSNVQLIRRLSMDSYMVRVYAGSLCDQTEYVSLEVEKGATAEDVIAIACRKLRLSGCDFKKQFELAEVFSSGGQLCKERRLDGTEHPVALQLLWPKVMSPPSGDGGLFDGYRFYLRRRDPVAPVGGWVARDQNAVDSFLLAFLTQPLAGKEFPDLCSLPDLNEHTLLHNLKARFNQKNIYTYVGSILIAVNPFKFFPIYNPKYVSMYQNKRLGELPPHIFAVADAAYHSMLRQKQNQCIVISGESGSGKTESTNLLLHHLTALSHKGLHGSGVEQTILGAGPVLEAFGNAKTVHNNNSSRFGKFIQVNYKQNGMVHGAVVEKYLLEKSRIVSQARDERNYHVFYYLLAGADEKEKEILQLLSAERYNYLSKSACYSVEGVDEQHEFARLKQSMEMVGFSQETQRKIFSVLSAVLHLGNVEFRKKGDKHHDESVMVKNGESIQIISKLLKVKERYVLEALTQKKTTAGDETFVINYKMDDAIATRDAMAKCVYSALFDWIVLKVNQALLAKKHDSEHEGDSIGVLDIFGFEDFGNNSFEQFCINYANEHLQYYFNQHIFRFEQEEYQREGIQWKNIEFIDNTGSLELFSKRSGGLFCLLDEECSFPGATSETLLNKFTHHQKSNPHYQVSQLKEGAFSVMHYAGRVKYFVKDFREKNLDLVRPEIVATLKKSSLTFVRELMGIDPVAVLRWSILRAFFRCFFAFIKAGKMYRKSGGKENCKRPKKGTDTPVQTVISDGLQNPESGHHSCIHPRQQTDFLIQQQKEEIHEELLLYSTLENSLSEHEVQVIRKAHKLLMRNKSFKPKPRPSLSFHDIKALKAIANRTMGSSARGTGSKKQPPTVGVQFQWSLARLMNTLNQANPYFIRCIKSNKEKAPCIFDEELVMRQLRYTGMLATVKIRQSGYNYRLTFDEFTTLYKILLPRKQQHTKDDIKIFLTLMDLQEENYQIGINKIFLRESEKMRLDEALHSAIMKRVIAIQRWTKVCLERQAFTRLRESAVIIQKHIRRFLAQRDFQESLLYQIHSAAAVMLQTHIRSYLARRLFLAKRSAVIYIQSYIQAVLMRRRFFELREEYYAMLAKEEEDKREQERERQLWEREQESARVKLKAERVKKDEIQRREKLVRGRLDKDSPLVESDHQRDRKEKLQSTASDEGVLVKASSSEELEEKDYHPTPRRDSEESSGIMEGSDTEMASVDKFSRSAFETPPPTPPSQRVQESAKTFHKISDEVKGRDIIIHRGTRPGKHKKSAAPLAKQESFSDLESTPTSPETSKTTNIPAPLEIPKSAPLFEERRREMDDVIIDHKDGLKKKEEGGEVEEQASGHLSPLHKAKRHWRNWVGASYGRAPSLAEPKFEFMRRTMHSINTMSTLFLGAEFKGNNVFPHSCIPSSSGRSFKLFPHKSTKKKKDDSEEDSEDSVSVQSRRSIEAILPQVPLSPNSLEKQGVISEEVSKSNHRRPKKKKRIVVDKNAIVSPGTEQPHSHMKVARSTEWQYADNMVITDVVELSLLDEFISQKQRGFSNDRGGNRQDTVFDRIFKGALDKFRKDLKSLIGVEVGKDKTIVRYRDLFEQFRHILESEMKREKTDAPLVMSINAFRGFLDEFRKQEEARSKDNKKDAYRIEKKNLKREKQKKNIDTIEYNGHRYQQVQFNIPTFCEVCTSLIWIMDKGYVCRECKLACHKKCYNKQHAPCKGLSDSKGQGSSQLFGAPLELLVTDTQRVPLVCERLMSTLERTGMYIEGIYRKSGAAPKVKELKVALEADAEQTALEDYHVHVLASVLKLFLRNLPEPLLTFGLFDDFLRTTEIKDEKEMIKSIFDVIRKLPKSSFDLFERLCFHLACVAMHCDSNKMSASALAVIFAPVLLGTNKHLQAQDAIALMPKQMICIEVILKEQIRTVKSKLEDIDILESAEKTTGERLNAVRASLRTVRQKSPMASPVRQPSVSTQKKDKVEEAIADLENSENCDIEMDTDSTELAKEEKVLTRHLMSIHKEKDKLTCKLSMLESRQGSSDEDVLTGDEADSLLGANGVSEEYAISFESAVTRPPLQHITKHRANLPDNRLLPGRFMRKAKSVSDMEDGSEDCSLDPLSTIIIRPSTKQPQSMDAVTLESSYVLVSELLGLEGDDEIMV